MDAAAVERWLQRVSGWIPTPLVSEGVPDARDLDQLREFLHQLHQWLRECGSPSVALRSLPKIDQLLGKLCRLGSLRFHESVFKQVIECVLELHTDQPSEQLEERVNSRMESRVWRSVTYPQALDTFQGVASTLSCQVSHYNRRAVLKLLESMVSDLKGLPETQWSASNKCLVPSPQLSDATINGLSELCLPLVTSGESAVAPLVESLLGCHGNGTKDAISPCFLKAVMATQANAYTDQQCSLQLSYEGRVALWSRYLPALQSEFLHLVDALSGKTQPSPADAKQLITSRGLPRACTENPALLSAVEELMESLLFASRGSDAALALLQQMAGCVRDSRARRALPHHRGQELASLQSQLQPDPQKLSLTLVGLHINNISNCLSEMATAAPTRLSRAWLLLMQFEVWYPVVVRLLLLGKLEDVPACLNVLAFYNMPTAVSRHDQFKVNLGTVVTSLRGLLSVSNLQPHDLRCALEQGFQDDQLTGVIQPLLMLFTNYGVDALQILSDIVQVASDGQQVNPMDTLDFLTDSIEFSLLGTIPRAFMEETKEAIGNRGQLLVTTLRSCKADCKEYQRERSARGGVSSEDVSWCHLLDRSGDVEERLVRATLTHGPGAGTQSHTPSIKR